MSGYNTQQFMELAQRADREALFAALQAAMVSLIDARYGGGPITDATFQHIQERLLIGKPYGAEHTGGRV